MLLTHHPLYSYPRLFCILAGRLQPTTIIFSIYKGSVKKYEHKVIIFCICGVFFKKYKRKGVLFCICEVFCKKMLKHKETIFSNLGEFCQEMFLLVNNI